MNRDQILTALSQATNETSEHYVQAVQRVRGHPPEIADTLLLHDISEPVKKCLAAQEEFSAGGFMVHTDTEATGFYDDVVAVKLIQKARERGSPKAAVDWLEKVLRTVRATGLCVMALSGVRVERRSSLTAQIELVPLNDLPPSCQKERLTREELYSPITTNLRFGPRHPPPVALIYKATLDPFLTRSAERKPRPPEEALKYHTLLEEAKLALTLVGPSAPLNVGYWFQFDDPDLQDALLGRSTSYAHPEIVPWGHAESVEIDPDRGAEVVSRYLALRAPIRDRIRIALQRLNQAVRRFQPGDKAVEMAVALETLLGVPEETSGENAHKVSLRGALLIGANAIERQGNRSVIRAVYRMRNQLMHTGKVDSKGVTVRGRGRVDPSRVATEGLAVTAKVIERVLFLGSLPDWDIFEVGGPPEADRIPPPGSLA